MNSRMGGDPAAEYHFQRGALRGTQLTLQESRLLQRGAEHSESIFLEGISSVRISFERDPGRIGWGVALGMMALVAFALAGPLDVLVARGLQEISAQIARDGAQASSLAHFLDSALGVLNFLVALMPIGALALLAWGVAHAVFGWMGHTALTLVLPSAEREFAVRGRDPLLLDFAENLAESVARVARRGA